MIVQAFFGLQTYFWASKDNNVLNLNFYMQITFGILILTVFIVCVYELHSSNQKMYSSWN